MQKKHFLYEGPLQATLVSARQRGVGRAPIPKSSNAALSGGLNLGATAFATSRVTSRLRATRSEAPASSSSSPRAPPHSTVDMDMFFFRKFQKFVS